MTYWTPILYECRRTSCDAFAVIFCKSKCTVSFPLMNIPLTSNNDTQNVAYCLTTARKLLKVHFMLKLKVEPEVCSVFYIPCNC